MRGGYTEPALPVSGTPESPQATGSSAQRCPRDSSQSLGRPQREHHLPWDENSIAPLPGVRLAPLDFRRGLVTGRAVVGSSCRGPGINVTAKNRNAFASCAAGMRPSVNADGGKKRRTRSNTPRPNVNGGAVDGRCRGPSRARIRLHRRSLRPRRRARGHAAERFRMIFAIGRAVMDRSRDRGGVRLSTAAKAVLRLNAGCTTANASSSSAVGNGKPPRVGPHAAADPSDLLDGRRPAKPRAASAARPPDRRQNVSAALGRR
jgi:hypothetical protein